MQMYAAGGNTILKDYPWGKYERHIDIAGAYGSFLADILKANSKSKGILFDQPQVSVMWLLTCHYLAIILHASG